MHGPRLLNVKQAINNTMSDLGLYRDDIDELIKTYNEKIEKLDHANCATLWHFDILTLHCAASLFALADKPVLKGKCIFESQSCPKYFLDYVNAYLSALDRAILEFTERHGLMAIRLARHMYAFIFAEDEHNCFPFEEETINAIIFSAKTSMSLSHAPLGTPSAMKQYYSVATELLRSGPTSGEIETLPGLVSHLSAVYDKYVVNQYAGPDKGGEAAKVSPSFGADSEHRLVVSTLSLSGYASPSPSASTIVSGTVHALH